MNKVKSKLTTYLIIGIIILGIILIGGLVYSYNQTLITQINTLKSEKTELKTQLDLQNSKVSVITSQFLPNYAEIISSFESAFHSMNICVAAVTSEQIAECEQAKLIFDSSKQVYTQKINNNVKIIKNNNLSN